MENEIQLSYKNQFLTINPIGGGIKQYYLVDSGRRKDLIYGYAKDVEKSGSMGDILFPFPGRIENSEYYFEGKKYKLFGLKIKDGHAIHGFAKDALFSIIEEQANSVRLCFEIKKSEYESKGFPFSLRLTINYLLDDSGLTCQAEVENVGNEKAPFGLGFHPYFKVAEKVDDMLLQIMAKKLVEFAPNLKPTGKYQNIEKTEVNFAKKKKIGNKVIDNCFYGLDFNKNGKNYTYLSAENGQTLSIWQDKNFPFLQVYSADTIGEAHFRKGLALEAQTCTGFVLNMPQMGLIILSPGEKFEGSWGVGI